MAGKLQAEGGKTANKRQSVTNRRRAFRSSVLTTYGSPPTSSNCCYSCYPKVGYALRDFAATARGNDDTVQRRGDCGHKERKKSRKLLRDSIAIRGSC
jgi:hypothetical protein